jgi:ABC-2 type transport system permease protein
MAGIGFTAFLAPGILMMSVIQNSFANSSSSIVVAKIQGNIVDTLMPPLSPGELLAGYALGGATRGDCWRVMRWAAPRAVSFARR